jgi:hypothetical protein
MVMKKASLIGLSILFAAAGSGQTIPDSALYFGQTPPGDVPKVFAPGLVSTNDQEHGVPSFSPDGAEVFWQTNKLENGNWLILVMTSRRVGDKWTAPEQALYECKPFIKMETGE